MKIFDFDAFKAHGENFLQVLCSELAETGVFVNSLECDHLCFRVSNLEEYVFYKNVLTDHGQLLTEAIVNGRAISTFLLNVSFQTNHHNVRLLELPAPKVETLYETGFEHAEFVVKDCFKTFTANLSQLHFTEAGNQVLNPELCLKLKKGKQVKFHYNSLQRIIELEQASIKDIIFDFDGTLIKSRENIYEINRIVFSKALNREVSLQESIEKFHPEFSKLFEAFAVTCQVKRSEAIANWGVVAEGFSYDLFEGVYNFLTWLQNRGIRLHLWTARDEYSARSILTKHGIEHFFTTLSFATDIESKPHTSSLTFDWKSAEKNQVIVVGDSPSDIIGAKNINAIRGAALWDKHSNKSSLVASGAELFFHEIADFKDYLK
ncbi:MAG: VOC family protein [Bdellovibrionota bacterium]